MAKIQRKTQKIFAGNATSDQITAFGTAKNTNPTYTTDLNAIQTNVYTQGWTPSLMSDLAPYLQDSNALWYLVTTQLAYLFQQGIAEWDAGTEYSINSLCKQGENIYVSLQDGNINNAVTNSSYWKIFGDVDNKILSTLQALYPVGSIYLTVNSTCPLSLLIPNSQWQLIGSGRALWTGNGSNGGSTISAGLPNIIGKIDASSSPNTNQAFGETSRVNTIVEGAFEGIWGGQDACLDAGGHEMLRGFKINASNSNSTYGQSNTVQPPAYVINAFRRIA